MSWSSPRIVGLALVGCAACSPGPPEQHVATSFSPLELPRSAASSHASSPSPLPVSARPSSESPQPTTAAAFADGLGKCAPASAEIVPCESRDKLPPGDTQTSFSIVAGEIDGEERTADAVERVRRRIKACLLAERARGRYFAPKTIACVALHFEPGGNVDETAIQFPSGVPASLETCAERAAKAQTFEPAPRGYAIISLHLPLALTRGDVLP